MLNGNSLQGKVFPGGKSTKRRPARGKRSVLCDDLKAAASVLAIIRFLQEAPATPPFTLSAKQLLSCQFGKMPVSKYPSHHRPSALSVIEEEGQLRLVFCSFPQVTATVGE